MKLKLGSKGQAGSLALVMGVVVTVVALFIGLFLYVQVLEAFTDQQIVNVSGTNVTTRILTGHGNRTAGLNSSLTSMTSNTESGFNLAAIIPIVLVAFAIIGILTGAGIARRT
jgi:hypothetical protein